MLAKSSSWLVGIAKAKSEGKYKGRAPTARAKAEKVKQLKAAGVGPSHIARQLGISRTSVFRILTACRAIISARQPMAYMCGLGNDEQDNCHYSGER